MNLKTIYVAAGCFWGVEAYFSQIKGIISTEVAYINGGKENITYKEVCNGSGHVEAVKLVYDESVISKKDIWFLYLRIVNPYSLNKQGNDKGIQYRIGIYADNEEELKEFIDLNNQFKLSENKDNFFEMELVRDYTKAEEYHQDYLEKNPFGYCHINLTNIPQEFLKDENK